MITPRYRLLVALSLPALVAGCRDSTPDTASSSMPSVPEISPADLDSTTAPCQDFHQYAMGGWYRRTPRLERTEHRFGPDQSRAGAALRQLVAAAPALAATSRDPALRAVGFFHGSCLLDTSGTAPGTVGDTARARHCFGATRAHLDRALFELLMEHVWPPAARVESRQFWPNMQAGAADRFRASSALTESTKQQLLELTPRIKLYASEAGNTRDHTTELWGGDDLPPSPRGRVPANVPFSGDVAATWLYRDYAALNLSPTDFARNLALMTAAPDTVPLPAVPGPDGTRLVLLDLLLGDEEYGAGVAYEEVALPLSMLIPPVIDGTVDIGAWYGTLGPLAGHEMSHGTWHGGGRTTPLNEASATERAAFFEEQLRGQLQSFAHPFDDLFGVLVSHDAFRRALRNRSWPTIDGFTAEQRFFLGVARSWRGGPVTRSPTENAQARSRVLTNGTLSAMPAFARAFGCKAGDPMVGGRVWYEDPWRGVVLTAEHRAGFYADSAARMSRGMSEVLLRGLELTSEQFAAIRRLHAGYRAQRAALADSLASGVDSTAGYGRLLRLVARQFGEMRALLTPAQQAVFDGRARVWMQERRAAGSPAAIPGVP